MKRTLGSRCYLERQLVRTAKTPKIINQDNSLPSRQSFSSRRKCFGYLSFSQNFSARICSTKILSAKIFFHKFSEEKKTIKIFAESVSTKHYICRPTFRTWWHELRVPTSWRFWLMKGSLRPSRNKQPNEEQNNFSCQKEQQHEEQNIL